MKFNVVSGNQSHASSSLDAHAQIEELIKNNPVFLFMKGTPETPQCGFSAKTSQILNSWNIPYQSFNVLSDQGIREGIKAYSNWPTIPQLYVNREFIGGCDIITELSESGELQEILQEALPNMEITPPLPPAEVQRISVQEAQEMLAKNSELKLLDLSHTHTHLDIEQLQRLDQILVDEILQTWDENTPLLLVCDHGIRSIEAGNFFATHGFQNIYSVDGGLAAWSETLTSF